MNKGIGSFLERILPSTTISPGAKPERQKVYILLTLKKSNETDQGTLGQPQKYVPQNFLWIILMWCNLPEPSTFNVGENTMWATNKENIISMGNVTCL